MTFLATVAAAHLPREVTTLSQSLQRPVTAHPQHAGMDARLVVQKAWAPLRSFLRKVTTLSFAINAAAALGFIFLGKFALILFTGRQEFAVAYPTMLALLVGLAFNYTLFWNRPLLLSLGLPEFPIWVTLIVGLIKVTLAFWLVPQYGMVAAGALLSFYYIASVGVMALRGVKEIK